MPAMLAGRPVLKFLLALAAIAGVLVYWANALPVGKWRRAAHDDFETSLVVAVVLGSALVVHACAPPRWLKAIGIVVSLALVAAFGWFVVLMGRGGPAG